MRVRPYVLWIELKGFYAEESDEPIVVVRDGIVLDANDTARRRGMEVGISLRQARAMLHGGVFRTWLREEYEARSRAWLDRCVDFTGVIEPADQHSAWLDLSLHPNPVDVAERLIAVLNKTTGLQVSYGAATSKWIACLAALHGDCGLAVRDPAAFLAALPTAELLPVLPEHRERLRLLGYHTIGEVAALSLPTLREQFDEQGLLIHAASLGSLQHPAQAVYPPSSITESIVFDGAVETTEMIHDACRALAQGIGARLSNRGLQSGKLRLTLELEDGKLQPLSRVFTKPLRCPRSVHAALRLLIDPALDSPIASIRAVVPDLEKVRQFQPSLIEGASPRGPLQADAAIRQVRTVFGDRSVQLGKEIVLPRRLKVLKEWKHATGWR
jgi:DNA polymerase IV